MTSKQRLLKGQGNPFLGEWRILRMELWDLQYINMEVPAYIRFGEQRTGEFQFGLVRGWLDYEVSHRGECPTVEFSWDGQDETEPVSGRGRAKLKGNSLVGRIAIHLGDKSGFIATKI
jgi:hypothetical protein